VQFNGSGLISSGFTVQGDTNNTGTIINFSSIELLSTPSSGAARVAAVDGFINTLLITVAPNQSFNAFDPIEFNLNTAGGGTAEANVQFTILAVSALGVQETFTSQIFTLNGPSGGAANRFRFDALNGEAISSVSFTAQKVTAITVGDLRQARVTLTNAATPIPEPGTLSIVGVALLGLGLSLRRRSVIR